MPVSHAAMQLLDAVISDNTDKNTERCPVDFVAKKVFVRWPGDQDKVEVRLV